MRLWHQDLITKLPRQQLLGQHRECAALRGRGWGKPHATVNYVFEHSPYKLYQYHVLIMEEMVKRGYQPAQSWFNPSYRGKTAPPYQEINPVPLTSPIYPEHGESYFKECLDNLQNKGILLEGLR
ncbi:TIGR02328 family protein [Streptococcus ovuberis]|uniref:Pyrimidine dimer DNA glycosylase n=1 Tax=Streptococcus ovuberis TaxID=1936207 RepID=A0A7X6MXD5_9STRE|nr:TIGR02328 family protein [Streptococcus ovuberis]NKZ20115.1 hypothetical protein [Streptococcus ovuberis]